MYVLRFQHCEPEKSGENATTTAFMVLQKHSSPSQWIFLVIDVTLSIDLFYSFLSANFGNIYAKPSISCSRFGAFPILHIILVGI